MALTPCEQAAANLERYNGWLEQIYAGRIIEHSHGDKTTRWSSGNINGLLGLIRLAQAKVDACNGDRSRGRFIQNTPSDE